MDAQPCKFALKSIVLYATNGRVLWYGNYTSVELVIKSTFSRKKIKDRGEQKHLPVGLSLVVPSGATRVGTGGDVCSYHGGSPARPP